MPDACTYMFDDYVFDFEMYSIRNGEYVYHELNLFIGMAQYVNMNDWDNDKFLQFIKNLKSNTPCEFEYIIEEEGLNQWQFHDGLLKLLITSGGRIYDEGILRIEEKHIIKLQELHDAIKNYKY